MAHNLEIKSGKASMAFLAAEGDPWHRLGQPMAAGMTKEEWRKATGLAWHVKKVPLFANVISLGLPDSTNPVSAHGTPQFLRGVKLENKVAIVRDDNAHVLGIASEQYQPHQPSEVLDWFESYIAHDPRFTLDTAGVLKNGEIIWAQASFCEEMTVAGDKHRARLLMTTSYDGSMATINKAGMVRVVCNNTLSADLADSRAIVRTRHNTKFNAERVTKELAAIAHGFDDYKVMGEAMARARMSERDTAEFFNRVLGIADDTKESELSTKKRNALASLSEAYLTTSKETDASTAWCALNAVTRYVDHDKHVRANGSDVAEARVIATQFGTGAAMKANAVQLLYRQEGGKPVAGYRAQAVAELAERRDALADHSADASLLESILA